MAGAAVKRQRWGQVLRNEPVIHIKQASGKVVVDDRASNQGLVAQVFATAKPLINQAKIGFSTDPVLLY